MEELGDYIYIVVIVIAALASVFKKRKKIEDAQTTVSSQLPDLSDVLSEDRDDVFNKSLYVEPEKSFQEIIAEKFEATKTKFEMMETTSKYDSDVYAKDKIDDLPTVDEPIWLDAINLEDVDEAKKAFIYSEIMTRKYS